MNVTEALSILRARKAGGEPFRVLLASGFTPLHLKTLMQAHLQQTLPDRSVEMDTGLFGNLAETIDGAVNQNRHGLVVVIEWADLDPRLGYREAQAWGHKVSGSIVDTCRNALDRLAGSLEAVPATIKVAVSTPTLRLVPAFSVPAWGTGIHELALQELLAAFAARVGRVPQRSVLNAHWLGEHSPASARHDAEADLRFGFPYTVPHASALAEGLSRLLLPRTPKKGLITDLDDTLWHGLVGEAGPDEISWDLATNQQLHGLYQALLQALADSGVLIAVASKNDREVVDQALQRSDLRISPAAIFPLEVHWEPKSTSVARILEVWNISADAVVFIDDNPLEIAEVSSVYPDLECVRFPQRDNAAGVKLLERLRDLFARSEVSYEDSIRLQSIRSTAALRGERAGGTDQESLLASLDATVEIDFCAGPDDRRAFELVNKTNQFNLNGRRFQPADWAAAHGRPGAWLAVVSYQDKFGALGKIAVAQGRAIESRLYIDTWVMSCRAFSRRIEYAVLAELLKRYSPSDMLLDFAITSKNGPLRSFVQSVTGAEAPSTCVITRERFDAACPRLYHRVVLTGETQDA
jgi:FkbH-like protein